MSRPAALLAFALVAALMVATAAEPRVIVVFGDSLTEGGALPKEQRDKVWVSVLQKRAGERATFVNEGKGGRPTDSVKEFEAMLKRRPRADVLVIALGGNDSRDVSGTCVAKAVENVTAMVAKGRAAYGAGAAIVLVGPANIRKDALGPTRPIADQREANLKDLGTAFAALAKGTGCEYVSLFGVIPAASLAKDGVHPDADGNAAIADVLGPKLLPPAP